ncbi:PspC domain-containing protein [Oceanobacillus kapialis]|uniref:PspC domain-containing protein n=1 Tax=Oceanobacillus kapialis TaxID=481353 RepID=A0ABW5Q0Q3_9BACI
MKKLYRSNSNKMVGGIFGGLAEYIQVDATILRLVFVILLFMSFFTVALLYAVALFIIPNEREL